MAILTPVWEIRLMTGTQRPDMCFYLEMGRSAGLHASSKPLRRTLRNAEYMAMTYAANQAKWYRSILSELGYTINTPIPIHGDNKGAIDLALNPVTGRRSKHIDIKHHVPRVDEHR